MDKHNTSLRRLADVVAAILLLAIVNSCASIGTPSGGPRDYAPPVYKGSTPKQNQTNVKSKKIEIEFDEILQLDNPSENVVISPPQKEMPKISAQGRKINIELLDSLIPNTTYAIDFGDAIKDNNEGNILSGFSLAFSTGDKTDSLQIAGTVLNAADLEPITGMTIGIHSDTTDTALTTKPFERISRSDAFGRFKIRNLTPGKYRIYGLKDADRSYTYNNTSEDIAFSKEIIIPTAEGTTETDTIKIKEVKDGKETTRDSIAVRNTTRYLPDSILLLAFNQGKDALYLSKADRQERKRLTVIFSTKTDTLPQLEPLNFTPSVPDWYILERTVRNDTLNYWIKDSATYNIDTLVFAAKYKASDTLMNIIDQRDTLEFIARKEVKAAGENTGGRRRRRNNADTLTVKYMEITPKVNAVTEVYASPRFVFDQPVKHIDTAAIHLQIMEDSTWTDVKGFKFYADTLSPRTYILENPWKFASEYKFTIDSLGAEGIYGEYTKGLTQTIKIKKSEEYSNLYIETKGVESGAFIELLNKSDKAVRYATVRNGGAEFVFVQPGTYYARLVIDSDGDHKFTGGEYPNRQPERVYYYNNPIELKPNWDVEQTWDVYAIPVERQKPYEIVKNKPANYKKEDDADRKDKENDPIYSNRPTTNLQF